MPSFLHIFEEKNFSFKQALDQKLLTMVRHKLCLPLKLLKAIKYFAFFLESNRLVTLDELYS